jgi:hypothetical protein
MLHFRPTRHRPGEEPPARKRSTGLPSDAAIADDSTQVAGRYRIIERIGTGGTGIVYRARDEVSGRLVAFKHLLLARTGNRAKTMAALFEREYYTLVRLKHPRIIDVYDFGVTAEGPYYTMELLEGSDLGQLRQLSCSDVCRHLRDVASSLALLHAQRLVHRDVSPRNIRLTADGTARLLDFGALAPFGMSTDVIGTPPFMAPEVLNQLPLDPRTDLYSLGAVGYFCLTGRQAFPAREVNELPRLWQTPPIPPSALVPDVPAELDRLILSMLSPDPLGRPETAAAVIDQLTMIGRLPPEQHERAEQSYFLSSPIVGRDAQVAWIVARIEQALAGAGSEVFIEGAAGIGKTRLADELCLAGTLKGAIAARADAESTDASFGVAVTLARRLLEACPEIAQRTAQPHAAVLRALAPELADALGGPESSLMTSDAAERRTRVHFALREWFLAVSRERALLVCVDNLHDADDDSASFLAALGRESRGARLLVLTTLRTGSTLGAPETVKILRERAQRFKLPALDARSCELLAGGLFGGAVNAGRVGNLLFERSGGVPRQFIELAQLMVKKKIAKYEAGSWVLPLDVADHELPARSEEILAARLSELGPDAVALAQTLSVHTGAVPLAVALAVSELPEQRRTYAVLDELLAEQVLVFESDGYRFRHDAMREAVLSRMDLETRRKAQLRAAEALLAFEAGGVAERVEAALHLVDAGDERRGARILVTAARELAAAAGTHRNANQLVRALCRMVRAYDGQGRSDYELGALLFPLMPLAYYSASWQFILEYGERAIDIGIRITGLGRAAELASEVGPAEALKLGLGAGAAGFAEHAADTGYDLKSAIGATIGMVPACVGVYATCFDNETVSRIARAVAPLAFFGEQHIAYAMYLFTLAEARLLGSESESHPLWKDALSRFEDPACANAIGEARSKALRGAVLFMHGILDAYCFGDDALAKPRQMENLGVKAWEVTADQIRVLYYALRGESSEVKACMDRVELNAIQGAQTWQSELFWPALLLNADVLASDAMAARRRCVQLERRAQDVVTLKPQAEAARAAYLMLRGDVSAAISLYEKLLPCFPFRRCVGWETTRAYFARALNACGAHERAKAVLQEVMANMVPSDEAYVAHFLEVRRQFALAESGLGNHAAAGTMLDELLAKHGHESNPLLVGLLHQARAEVAQRANEGETAAKHRAEMDRRFRSTGNPALIAQCERAQRSAARLSSVHPDGEGERRAPNTASAPISTAGPAFTFPRTAPARLDEILAGSEEPMEAALRFVMRQTQARRAYLYVPADCDLQLAWSSTNEEPPESCLEELERWMAVVRENDRHGATHDGRSKLVVETVTISGYRMVALRSDARTIVGGLALEVDPKAESVGSSDLFDALGRVVEEHGQDSLCFITA